MKRASALFLLKTLEERRITQAALGGIVSDCQALWDTALGHIQQTLCTKGIDVQLSELVDKQVLYPFGGLQSDYQREKYFTESLSLLVSVYDSILFT